MPYIKPEERAQLDPAIDALVLAIQSIPGVAFRVHRQKFVDSMEGKPGGDADAPDPPPVQPVLDMAGRINYVCTRLALKLIEPYKSYSTIAMITGVFSNISAEFYRRYAAPYEDKKIAENGDVY